MKYRYLIWDFDGTLFDTYPPMAEAMHRALGSLGIDVPNGEIQALMKKSMLYTFGFFVDQYALEEQLLKDRYREALNDLGLDAVRPFPLIAELLERVRAGGGRHFIFTHRGGSIFKYLDHYGLAPYFGEVLSIDSGIARKPAPDGFLYLMEKHRLQRAAVLAVGDRAIDILAAGGAGIATCLFAGGEGPKDGVGASPDYCITDYTQLFGILGLQ